MYAHTNTHINIIHMHIHIHIHIHIYTRTCIYKYIYICVYVHTLHYIASHHITSHHITLHYITLYYIDTYIQYMCRYITYMYIYIYVITFIYVGISPYSFNGFIPWCFRFAAASWPPSCFSRSCRCRADALLELLDQNLIQMFFYSTSSISSRFPELLQSGSWTNPACLACFSEKK